MAFRFWRRFKIAPGVTLNLSKSGGSLSFGPRGGKLTVGPRGVRATAGLPGTGLFYTKHVSSAGSGRKTATVKAPQALPVEDRLNLGFFERLTIPAAEKALVTGFKEVGRGDERKALEHLKESAHLADGAFIAGLLSLKNNRLQDAGRYLSAAVKNHAQLGKHFSKYGISPVLALPVTEEISAHIGPDLRGALLGLVEVCQALGRWQDAMTCLERLRRLEPHDVVVRLSLAELLLEARLGDKTTCQKVVRLAEGVENESPIHTALLLYKARALRGLGLHDAARQVLTVALRKTRDRSDELLRALRYERALVYEALGQAKRARTDLERLYAEAPNYEDVAEKLGL